MIKSSLPKDNSASLNCALITGATSGIGRATALVLAAEGFDVVLMGRRADRLAELQVEILAGFPGLRVTCLSCDLQDSKQLAELVMQNFGVLQNVNVLINNAGLAKGTEPVSKSKWSDWEQMIDTNIKGLFQLTHLMLPLLQKHPQAHLVNLGSVAGRLVYPGGAVYCATKFAVRAFSEGLRMDLQGKNIRVTNIEPGMVQTEFSLVRFADEDKANLVYEGMTPLSAEDIAQSILWCLKRPAHVNIQELVIYPTEQASVGQVYRHKN